MVFARLSLRLLDWYQDGLMHSVQPTRGSDANMNSVRTELLIRRSRRATRTSGHRASRR